MNRLNKMDKFQIKLDNYKKALSRLHDSINESTKYENNSVFKDGMIFRFRRTAELSLNVIREYLIQEHIININTPKNIMREAFYNDIISDDVGWLQILEDNNISSHIYDEDVANELFNRIITKHISLFDDLLIKIGYNKETLEAMNEIDNILNQKIIAKKYSTTKELFDDLNS